MPDTNNKEYLEKGLELVTREKEIKEELNTLSRAKQVKEEKYKSLEKTKDDVIDEKTKEAQKEISRTYNEMLYQADTKVKNAESEKQKRKSALEKQRIEKDTKVYVEDNDRIKDIIKQKLKNYKLPWFVNTNLYYSLFMPRTFKEIITLIITLILVFGVLPLGLYAYLGKKLEFQNPILLIVIYIADIALFGCLYMLIYNKTVDKHKGELEEIHLFRKDMQENKKKIKKTTNKIKNDKDETNYDLADVDAKIRSAKKELDETQDKKLKALRQFEESIKYNITKEVEKASCADIIQARKELDDAHKQYDELDKELNQIQQTLATDYAPYMGAELTKETFQKKLNELPKEESNKNETDSVKEITKDETKNVQQIEAKEIPQITKNETQETDTQKTETQETDSQK